jgi:hypothetical protein
MLHNMRHLMNSKVRSMRWYASLIRARLAKF